MVFDRTKYANCQKCPLNTKSVVLGTGRSVPRIVVVGDAPGHDEEVKGEPFVGVAGNWLFAAINKAGIGQVWKTNVLARRPNQGGVKGHEGSVALSYCMNGFRHEIAWLVSKGVKVVVPTGNVALKAFGFLESESITKVRGSVYMFYVDREGKVPQLVKTDDGKRMEFVVVPTFHPSYIMRGQTQDEPAWINDLVKARDIAEGGYTPPKEKFNLNPTVAQVEAFANKVTRGKKRKVLAVDIEKTGGLSPETGDIVMVGFALDGEEALVVPFFRSDGDKFVPVWTDQKAYEKVVKAVNQMLSGADLMFQNAAFDVRALRAHGFLVKKWSVKHDTMIAHHVISPELPHNIGRIVSEFGRTQYWKEHMLTSTKAMARVEDGEFRKYNARDTVTLHQIIGPMTEELKEMETYGLYQEISVPLLEPVIQMMDNGLRVSTGKLKKWTKELQELCDELERTMQEITGVPQGFMWGSSDYLGLLCYGVVADQFLKAQQEYDQYFAVGNTKKKDTKKFAEIKRKVMVVRSVEPFMVPGSAPRSEKGGISFSKDGLRTITIQLNNRIEKLRNMKRFTGEHQKELVRLEAASKWARVYKEWVKNQKLLSTFTNFKVGKDGRYHAPYKIVGTSSGRLASGDKAGTGYGNMQNIPPEARKVFVAPKGRVLVEADYSNLELRILGFLSNEKTMIDAFAQGKNIHDENTKAMFGIDEGHKDWAKRRKLAKTYIFARNYGGTLEGVYRKIVEQEPEMDLTFQKFVQVDKAYRKSRPAYAKWYDDTVRKVQITGQNENAFGRVRYFLKGGNAAVRAGLNHPMQSTAADIINGALIRLSKVIEGPKWSDVLLCASVHDSIMVECDTKHAHEVGKMLKVVMEQPVKILGRLRVFPVDVKIGACWGEMKETEV